MPLDPEIEELFRCQPLLAARPRAQWSVTRLPGLTNLSYRVRGGDADYVLRWPGPGSRRYLDRHAESQAQAAMTKIGIAPPLLADDPASGWQISQFLPGARSLSAADLSSPVILDQVAGLLGRLHGSGLRLTARQSPEAAIDTYLELAPRPDIVAARRNLTPVLEALGRNPLPATLCHIDPNPANFLLLPDGSLRLIDWEFSAMCDPLWDVAALGLSADLAPAQIEHLLAATLGPGQTARLHLYLAALELVAASWAVAEIALGNQAPELTELCARHLANLDRRLSDPNLARHLSSA
jgi:thiamine kinase-like enzyme